jgi:hypothetical protein
VTEMKLKLLIHFFFNFILIFYPNPLCNISKRAVFLFFFVKTWSLTKSIYHVLSRDKMNLAAEIIKSYFQKKQPEMNHSFYCLFSDYLIRPSRKYFANQKWEVATSRLWSSFHKIHDLYDINRGFKPYLLFFIWIKACSM